MALTLTCTYPTLAVASVGCDARLHRRFIAALAAHLARGTSRHVRTLEEYDAFLSVTPPAEGDERWRVPRHIEYDIARRHVVHAVYDDADEAARFLVYDADPVPVAKVRPIILLVAADEGVTPSVLRFLDLLRRLQPSPLDPRTPLLVWLDAAPATPRTELARAEHNLHAQHDLAEVPIIRGMPDTHGSLDESLDTLVGWLNDVSSMAHMAADQLFVFPIQDVFTVRTGAVVATGRVWRGTVRRGDLVELVTRTGQRQPARIADILAFHVIDIATAGDNVGCFVEGPSSEDLESGAILAVPGAVQFGTSFRCAICAPWGDIPLHDGEAITCNVWHYRQQPGTLKLETGAPTLAPPSWGEAHIELTEPIPLAIGVRGRVFFAPQSAEAWYVITDVPV